MYTHVERAAALCTLRDYITDHVVIGLNALDSFDSYVVHVQTQLPFVLHYVPRPS